MMPGGRASGLSRELRPWRPVIGAWTLETRHREAVMRAEDARATLDARGKTITTWIAAEAADLLHMMEEGEILALDVDDEPGVIPDLEAWAEAAGHRVLEIVDLGGTQRIFLARGAERPLASSMAVVVSDAGLEELLSPLGFALAGALEAMAVHIYFQGPAVRVLDKKFLPHLKGWRRPFSRFARNGLAKAGHVHPHEKLGHIRSLGGTIYACAPSMAHLKVPLDRLFVDDIRVVEYLTFARVLEAADVQIYP